MTTPATPATPAAPAAPAADAVSLHDLIMNLPCAKGPYSEAGINARLAYKIGHRDARHAAAELATARESALVAERDALRAALPQWISIDDGRKPSFRKPILVRVDWHKRSESEDGQVEHEEGVDVTEGEYCPAPEHGSAYFESYQGTHHDASCVTHWMELPSPDLAAPAVEG